MRGAVFADTGFWIARLSPLDQLHAKARELSQGLNARLVVTTEMVLAETLNAYCSHGPFVRGLAVRFGDALAADPKVDIISQTPALFAVALQLYRERADKAWSLTDCMSFSVMKARGIKTALAHDRHFEQAGFKALLRG